MRFELLLPILLILPWPRLVDGLALNLLAANTVAVLMPLQGAPNSLPSLSLEEDGAGAGDTFLPSSSLPGFEGKKRPEDCHSSWFLGHLARSRGDIPVRDAAWRDVIRCDPGYVAFLMKILPDDAPLALYATQAQPTAASGWFWLAEIRGGFIAYNFTAVTDANRSEITALLQRGLALDPGDGLRWRELGDLLRPNDPQAAIAAYLQSCFHGDPGSNGCWLAGLTAEQLGDLPNAIRYLRYSHWQGARDRADELEAQLNVQK